MNQFHYPVTINKNQTRSRIEIQFGVGRVWVEARTFSADESAHTAQCQPFCFYLFGSFHIHSVWRFRVGLLWYLFTDTPDKLYCFIRQWLLIQLPLWSDIANSNFAFLLHRKRFEASSSMCYVSLWGVKATELCNKMLFIVSYVISEKERNVEIHFNEIG